jgi:allantoinase
MSLVIRGTRILLDGELRPACIHLHGGRIAGVHPIDAPPPDVPLVDAGNDVVMAGLVDTHVHVNEPGRTDWEGFASATRAAAAGGITTLFDMPLNSIPATTTVAALHAKQEAARGSAVVNVEFIGGVVPGNANALPSLHAEGVGLFKCFLVPSGVEEFPCVGVDDLRAAMPVLAELGAPLLVHAELPQHIVPIPQGDPRRYATYLASRPDVAETEAIALMIGLAEEYGTRVHIVHVSSTRSLALLRDARARGVDITCETCPHYLTFVAEDIPDGATEHKCAPPIRSRANRESLWRAVLDGEIDMIVSDHSPCPPAMKARERGDFFASWGGIASLQLGLPAVWHEARARGVSVATVAERMSAAPARLAGLGERKGRLAEGYDADIVIWDPESSVSVDTMTLYHRHPLTPYRGRPLTGLVRATYVAGIQVFGDGRILGEGREVAAAAVSSTP